MRIGTIVGIPSEYSRFGRILDNYGIGHTIETGNIPDDTDEGDEFAYRVELWGSDGGLAYDLED